MANRWGQNPAVRFMLNVVDGCIPSDMSTGNVEDIEEVRRLLYVAMTRAKDQLALVVPHRFYVHGQARGGDKHPYASRTCFIPASIAGDSENRVWPSATMAAGTAGYHAVGGQSVDLAARMCSKWRGSGI